MTGVAHELESGAVEGLAAAAERLLEEGATDHALVALVEAVAAAAGADLAIVRTASSPGGELVARAVEAASPALAAEVESTRLPATDVPGEESDIAADRLPDALRRAAERAGAAVVRIYPVFLNGRPAATVELYRAGGELSAREELLGRLAAAHVGVAVRLEREAFVGNGVRDAGVSSLELFGEALTAGADETATAEHVVRLAAEATGAGAAALWRIETDAPPTFLASFGSGERPASGEAVEQALAALLERPRDGVATTAEGGNGVRTATLPLGEPPVGALQLYFEDGGPAAEELELLSPFAARAALALRRSRRVGLITRALQRSQTVIGVVSQAIAQLSLTTRSRPRSSESPS